MDIVIRTILNYNHKYTGTILSRLCKRSHHATIVNRAWALNKLRSYPERYKIFFSCHRHESDTTDKMFKNQRAKECYEQELVQVRSILENSVHYNDTLFPSIKVVANVSSEEISELHSTDWSSKSVDENLRALKLLTFSYLNGADYTHSLFDSICEACLAKLPEFEDSQIKVLLQCLITLKSTVNSLTINNRFMKALNKECLKRFYPATVKQLLLITDAFHQLHKFDSDYIWRAMRKLYTKPGRLSGKEFVQALYYLDLHKLMNSVNMFEMECHLGECIHELSGNEIGIIARGFFLNKKGIRDAKMLSAIIEKTTNSIQSMDSLSIAYIMKLMRYSTRSSCPEKFKALLDNLTEELPRLSLPCLTHITQAFGAFPMYNEALTNGILKIVVENMHLTRLEDIERILFGICMVTPFTDYYTDICHKFLNEILSTYKTSRINEIDNYPLSLVRIVMYLTMKNIYVPELLQFIYNYDNLQKTYNIYYKNVTSELLILHCSVKIELPQYEGPLLSPNWYNSLTKKCGPNNYVPKNDKTLPIRSEVVHICKNKLEINVSADYIVPYYAGCDIIFGMDEQNNPIDVESILSAMPQSSIKSVNNDELKAIKWHAIIIVPSSLIVDHGGYVGIMHQKLRQLNILGYTPIPILEKDWKQIPEDEKEGFLRKLIYRDVRCSVAMK